MNKYEQDILKEGEHVGSGKPFVLPVCQLCEKRRILRWVVEIPRSEHS